LRLGGYGLACQSVGSEGRKRENNANRPGLGRFLCVEV